MYIPLCNLCLPYENNEIYESFIQFCCVSLIVLQRADWRGGTSQKYIPELIMINILCDIYT